MNVAGAEDGETVTISIGDRYEFEASAECVEQVFAEADRRRIEPATLVAEQFFNHDRSERRSQVATGGRTELEIDLGERANRQDVRRGAAEQQQSVSEFVAGACRRRLRDEESCASK
jgi:hypothetical protein